MNPTIPSMLWCLGTHTHSIGLPISTYPKDLVVMADSHNGCMVGPTKDDSTDEQ